MRPLEPLALVLGLMAGAVTAPNGISRDDVETASYVVRHVPIHGSHQTWHGTWVRSATGTVAFQNNDGTQLDFHFPMTPRGPIAAPARVRVGLRHA